jgi:hypothetical protein
VTVKRSAREDRTVEELETTSFLEMILGEIFLEERSTLILFFRGRGRRSGKTVREKSIFLQIFSGNSDRRDEQIPEIAIFFLSLRRRRRIRKRERERGKSFDESFPQFLSDFLNKREEKKEKEIVNKNKKELQERKKETHLLFVGEEIKRKTLFLFL